ncbi:MAG: sigma-70 family RNA polymerase sigma factor [Candidatus Eisenbacteria bacterium]|uniref:Sigma-70 family RNA polymerase sigma factor n=1 Tax=Eiseniibacteriota bacterium TaxID=2212470 RepID=A0A956SDR6_UNCEI|nr:sigma-70 family RNA polymerase sigma factor [Candidatus Eisenbacteria bacterium]MCB9892766.1 sigma-70 family RNA polymerase sigma factor [Planctomycetota bacterium]
MTTSAQVTQLLSELTEGRHEAMSDLLPLVYAELKRLARIRLRGEREEHTLSSTALVHEAYLKLVRLDRMEWQGRAHFFAVASGAMRRILVDHAERKRAAKRGGGRSRELLGGIEDGTAVPESGWILGDGQEEDVLALDRALGKLAAQNERHARIVEYRFFGGLSIEETACVLEISPATVKRDWTFARAWLDRELRTGGRDGGVAELGSGNDDVNDPTGVGDSGVGDSGVDDSGVDDAASST